MNDRTGRWARVCATGGAAAWAALAVLAKMGVARIGAIELMVLFAPLVIVPLGMELARILGAGGRLVEWARRAQPLGAAAAVVAILMPTGRTAAMIAMGWMVVCGLMATSGVLQLGRIVWGDAGRRARATVGKIWSVATAVAKIDLAVGGAWLVASRLGMRPMGIQEPIGLLTAVHFHFAGFATAMIAATTVKFGEGRVSGIPPNEKRVGWASPRVGRGTRWLKAIVVLVIGMPYVVAAGFVISPALKMGAATVFSASVAGLAVFLRIVGRRVNDRAARLLLEAAAVAVFAGMVLAGVYAVADFVKSDALPIPQMARTHGILNAVGFCLPGLLGWIMEGDGQESLSNSVNE